MRKPLATLALLLVAALAAPHAALADSAADKATAREVAIEGIGLFKAGKFADALDRLKRAQALYDAPVHLLYIARSEEKLGQLVEASETYRLLDHYTLPSGAPEAWTAAVDDGRKELATLEPRVPKLRIAAIPNDVPDATVQIDGAPVSAAVLGIARPVNPGTHHVVVAAKGYAPAEADAETKEGETKDVALTLTPSATATGTPAPGEVASPAKKGESTPIGFTGGLRLNAGVPTGTIGRFPAGSTGTDVNMSDAFQPGGGLELHAGMRVGQYFTPIFYGEGETLAPGNGVFGLKKAKNATSSSVGLGVLVGTPPGKMGGFGEFDLVFTNQFGLSVETATGQCDLSAKGGALRFGGGGIFPIGTWFHLTPYAMATIGRFTKLDATNCGLLKGRDIDSADQRVHSTIVLGVGGDVVLGPR